MLAVALEDRVLAHVDHHVEVARRPALGSGLALAREADAVAGIHAWRHLDRERLLLFDAALAVAAPQGSEIILPLPWQRGQVCCTEKKPCCMRT